jgi:arylsulfatase A-like enzyme
VEGDTRSEPRAGDADSDPSVAAPETATSAPSAAAPAPEVATEAVSDAAPEAALAPEAASSAQPAASLRPLIARDARRCARVALWGCAGLAGFELAAALLTSPAHDIRVLAAVRLVFLAGALMALLWLGLVPVLALAAGASRLVLAAYAPDRARTWKGLLAPAAPGLQPAAPWLWAGFAGALIYLGASSYITFRAITFFKEPQLTSLLLSIAQLVLVGVAVVVAMAVKPLAARLGSRFDAWLARRGPDAGRPRLAWLRDANPFGRVGPALIVMLLASLLPIWGAVLLMPQLAPKIPWRLIIALAVLAAVTSGASQYLERRQRRTGVPSGQPQGAAGRVRRLGVAVGGVVLLAATLLYIGADHEAKSVATTGSPLLSALIDVVRKTTDFDRDGYGFLLGENDCGPFEAAVHPLARDLPDNGIDEDCNGRDFSFRLPPASQAGARMPVPEDFRRDWNILLLTVDTVRYDHTGFGGYLAKTKRDTTPNLDQLVERSVSFTFANAPSAGTMASVPAILTSKFFHSGIALDENVPPRTPPRLKPENLLIAEIAKSQGYRTGAVLSHVYFKDWGMEQGFDTYDNEIGAKYEPHRVTSHEVTDKAIAWIAGHGQEKWFLWLHYLDPHGYYVEHPGEQSFGTTEEDRYDGELYYTDKHIGRLLKELSSMPGADRTIVIITSDHGDAFNEHGFINHGQALYRELLHVPLIVYVPGLPPRMAEGAVSPLDVVPTVADLVGATYEPDQFEGRSLVPQLFYGKDDRERVVFSETDWPDPQRAAMTVDHKLVYKLKRNLYELYDLRTDPWEKRNIATKDRSTLEAMKRHLDDWLERVYYARDGVSNQQIYKLREVLLAERPTPRQPVEGVRFDEGRIEVLGYDTDKDAYRPGDEVRVFVYFHVPGERPSEDFQLQIEAWPTTPPGVPAPKPARSSLRLTAGGVLPTSRWRKGEYIRDVFEVRLPGSWKGERLTLGLGMNARRSGWQAPTGPTRADAAHMAVLGEVALLPPAPPTPAGAADAGAADPPVGRFQRTRP